MWRVRLGGNTKLRGEAFKLDLEGFGERENSLAPPIAVFERLEVGRCLSFAGGDLGLHLLALLDDLLNDELNGFLLGAVAVLGQSLAHSQVVLERTLVIVGVGLVGGFVPMAKASGKTDEVARGCVETLGRSFLDSEPERVGKASKVVLGHDDSTVDVCGKEVHLPVLLSRNGLITSEHRVQITIYPSIISLICQEAAFSRFFGEKSFRMLILSQFVDPVLNLLRSVLIHKLRKIICPMKLWFYAFNKESARILAFLNRVSIKIQECCIICV